MARPAAPWQFEFGKLELRYSFLLTSGQWSDCTFVVGTEPNQTAVPSHKLILAIASPVFEAMFYGGLSESEVKDPVISIPDVRPDAFRALLQYIYTGTVTIDSFDLAWELWHGAQKYMLPHLVKECNTYIHSVVGPNIACRTFELASFFEDKILMDKCLEIISTNTKEALYNCFEDCKLNTLVTVLSLNHLNVESELYLFNAVARYAEAEEKTQRQSFCPSVDGGQTKILEYTFEEKVMLVDVESNPQSSPAVERDTEKFTRVVTSGHPADDENINDEGRVPEELTIKAALQKIRFLTLTPEEFEQGPARSGLLTEAETFAIIMNIVSKVSAVAMPSGFSECRERRQPDSAVEEPYATPRLRPSLKYRGAAINTPVEIVQGLASTDLATMKAAAHAARVMLSDDPTPQTIAQLVGAGVIPPLVAALKQLCNGLQCNAAWALANIAFMKSHTTAVVDGDAVPNLVALLQCSGEVAEQAAWALGNIAAAGGNHRCKVHAARALTNLCSKGTRSQITLLTAAAALQHYCLLLGECDTRDIVFQGIDRLLRNVQKDKVDAVCQKLQDLGVKKLIINMQQDHEDRVRQGASVLQKYFRDDYNEMQGRQ